MLKKLSSRNVLRVRLGWAGPMFATDRTIAWLFAVGPFLLFLIFATELSAQSQVEVPASQYTMAEGSLAWNISGLARNIEFDPQWIVLDPESFWYRRETDAGWEYRVVDAKTGLGISAFDHALLAASIGSADSNRLDVLDIAGPPDVRLVEVRSRQGTVVCHLPSYQCETANTELLPGGQSPDGEWHVIRDRSGLALRRPGHNESHPIQLTPFEESMSVRVRWAQGGERALVEILDASSVARAPLVASLDHESRPSPRLIPFIGGTRASDMAPQLRFTIITRTTINATEHGWRTIPVDLSATAWSSAIDGDQVFWTPDGTGLFVLLASRDGTRLTLWRIDAGTGTAAPVIEEQAAEGVLWNLNWAGSPNVRVGAEGRRVVWFSERDGWGHLWLYTLDADSEPRQLTSGDFVVRDILWMNDEATRLLITVAGYDPSEDSYNRDLAVLDVGTGALTRLTFGGADHAVSVSPTGRYFVDVTSALNRETTMSVYHTDGSLVKVVETSDVSRLRATGWSWPLRERIQLDSVSDDVYATVLWPTPFDSSATYPVVESLYPIPDGAWAPIRLGDALLNRFTHAQAVANLGFIVVFIDAPGTGLRSRAFRSGSRGNLHAVGLDDRVRALRVLASRHPQMDMERVGVYGNSGGGNAAVRALLARPDVYDVAVASGGNHDLRFGGPWVERHHGLTAGHPMKETNASLASQLSGSLLLAHGALDRVVHPAQTLGLAQAFINANRDVDVLLLPNRGHDVLNDPYFVRRLWDYFVRHLQHRRPPEYRIVDPQE